MKVQSKIITVFLLICCISISIHAQFDENQGVYEYIVKNIDGSFYEVKEKLKSDLLAKGIDLLYAENFSFSVKCPYKSAVFVLYDKNYAAGLMEINGETAPFAATIRLNLFEDEAGLHISMLNPLSINRTVFLDDEAVNEKSILIREKIRTLIKLLVNGEISEQQYGQNRKKGYIGRTMGVMAGGNFDGKINDLFKPQAMTIAEAVEKLNGIVAGNGDNWGLFTAYSCILKENEVAVVGLTGHKMAEKSFNIVRAGADKSRKNYQCPGLAHAAAYPIEVVLIKDDDKIKIQTVDTMFRMKMFFEDAGKWAFMKNMRMPGSIANEMKNKIKTALGTTF